MNKIEFKDLPDTTTPIDADNLNLLQENIENGMVNQEYLGNNPNIDDLRNVSGTYGIYNCSQAPSADIGVLEVIRYSQDWVLQRFTSLYNEKRTWERTYHDGTTWSNWTRNLSIVYSSYLSGSKDTSYTFPRSRSLYLVIVHVNGNDVHCIFDIVYGNGQYHTRIKDSSSSVTVTYNNGTVNIHNNYTAMIAIIEIPIQ